MKSHVINFFLVSLITILLVLSIFTKNKVNAEFFSNFHSPGEAIQYLKNVEAYKITEPNDDSHYGLNIEDSNSGWNCVATTFFFTDTEQNEIP